MSFIVQNISLAIYGVDYRSIRTSSRDGAIHFGSIEYT